MFLCKVQCFWNFLFDQTYIQKHISYRHLTGSENLPGQLLHGEMQSVLLLLWAILLNSMKIVINSNNNEAMLFIDQAHVTVS